MLSDDENEHIWLRRTEVGITGGDLPFMENLTVFGNFSLLNDSLIISEFKNIKTAFVT